MHDRETQLELAIQMERHRIQGLPSDLRASSTAVVAAVERLLVSTRNQHQKIQRDLKSCQGALQERTGMSLDPAEALMWNARMVDVPSVPPASGKAIQPPNPPNRTSWGRPVTSFGRRRGAGGA
jgi:hypothetical protein